MEVEDERATGDGEGFPEFLELGSISSLFGRCLSMYYSKHTENITLDPTALGQLHREQKDILDTIDELRKRGVGYFVDLPQIIVVGDQSSGKSSVLEAISRVRFPVKDGLCTRFATELVLRTESQTKVDVRVQPFVASEEACSFEERSFKKDELPRIIEDAKKRMLQTDSGFSEDVLRIEISGPDVPHLTFVDLPGFHHSEDENQSATVARKHSIILDVVSARNQAILQKVLSKVKHHDRQKERTLGIITKPDILTSNSQDEARSIRLAKNIDGSHELSLGWHVLRNRSEAESSDTDQERDKREQDFFQWSNWSAVPSKDRGVESLLKKLSSILLGHIRSNLQSLIESIEENINDCKTQLKHLGESSSTPKELRTRLKKVASHFHIMCLNAVRGNYADEFFGSMYPGSDTTAINDSRVRKIRTLLHDLNQAFAYVLETKGSRRVILHRNSTVPQQGTLCTGQEKDLPVFLQALTNQYNVKEPKNVPFKVITAELDVLVSASRGSEFPGTSNDDLAVKLFRDQSRPWEAIARQHLRLVLSMTKDFVTKLLEHITNSDKKICSAILSEVVGPFFEQKSNILESKLQELLYHYKSGLPQPFDTEFRLLLAQKRQKNIELGGIGGLIASRPVLFTESARTELARAKSSGPATEFGVDDLIDKSEVYYEMSLRTFMDSVVVLAVENCLMRDLPFTIKTEKFNQMEDSELERLTCESPETQEERKELQAEDDALKKGLQICSKFNTPKYSPLSSILIELENPSTTSGLTVGSSTRIRKASTNPVLLGAPPKKTRLDNPSSSANLEPEGSLAPLRTTVAPPELMGVSSGLVADMNPKSDLLGAPNESGPSSVAPAPLMIPLEPANTVLPTLAETTGSTSNMPEKGRLPETKPGSPNLQNDLKDVKGSSQPRKCYNPLPSRPSKSSIFVEVPIPIKANDKEIDAFQHICFEEPYGKYSPEELRLFASMMV
ncbi:P-loop containing nucleoside triphosphate hydrolase protein [Hypoxylon crocopeplum]|nr:P-loop containing nucleoside triphosphate hydrolase protein [Hypoxylon crocopeplum]